MLKKLLSILPLLIGCASNHPPLATVEKVDLERYAGKWYDVASFPQRFQKGCHCTSATYTLKEDYVEVFNTCFKKEKNRVSDITGKAFIEDTESNAKLKVQFFWPFRGKYWIIGLDDDYQFAVVGEPSRSYLWILSRHPHPDEDELQKWIDVAKEKGFDVTKLERVVHDCE
jgi:apolipoprotein D and lipocalin family protein